MRIIFGAIGAAGYMFTSQYTIFIWLYYLMAHAWDYPCFLLMLVSFPMVLIGIGIFIWRTCRLESISFPNLSMFIYFYAPSSALYAMWVIFTMKCFTWP